MRALCSTGETRRAALCRAASVLCTWGSVFVYVAAHAVGVCARTVRGCSHAERTSVPVVWAARALCEAVLLGCWGLGGVTEKAPRPPRSTIWPAVLRGFRAYATLVAGASGAFWGLSRDSEARVVGAPARKWRPRAALWGLTGRARLASVRQRHSQFLACKLARCLGPKGQECWFVSASHCLFDLTLLVHQHA